MYSGYEKYTSLSSLVKLYNLKGKYGHSHSSLNDLLSFLGGMLPKDNTLPSFAYEAKKTMFILGLRYKKIYACPNDCILYRKEYAIISQYPTCGVSRWKKKKIFLRINIGKEFRPKFYGIFYLFLDLCNVSITTNC